MEMPLLEVKHLKKHFTNTTGFLFSRVTSVIKAVDDISFDIMPGETLGLVGESGCGKSTTARCIVRAIAPSEGEIVLTRDGDSVDLSGLNENELRRVCKDVQMVFQDPYSSLNPRLNIKSIIGEPLLVNGIATGSELEARVVELIRLVGLRPEYMNRYPHAFSGGQRQRIAIARALALNPKLIVCDEAVSALDVSIQAQIINLLQDLQDQFDLTYLFIAHDLSVVKHICDRVAVMYVGKIAEVAPTEELFENPQHPYTEALISAVPKPDPRYRSEKELLEGEVADAAAPPPGCYFHPRCEYAQEICSKEHPELLACENATQRPHVSGCHFRDELHLEGIAYGNQTEIS